MEFIRTDREEIGYEKDCKIAVGESITLLCSL